MSEKIDNIQKVLTAFLPDYSAKMHVRQIARVINMNRQTASATLKKMEQARIMDSEIEGRNKLYFINKSSPKTKILLENAENAKKLDICKKKEISRLIDYLDEGAVVLLFGSYAKGNERASSDIDILFIGRGKKNLGTFEKETAREVQIFKMSEKQFLGKLLRKDHLVIEAVRNHVCLRNTERFVDLMWRANYG